MMIKKAMLAALSAAGITHAFSTSQLFDLEALNQNEAATPEPGSLQMFANVSSVEYLLQLLGALGPYSLSQAIGNSFDVNEEFNLGGIDFKLNQVNVTQLRIPDNHMGFVGESDTLRTTLRGMDITLAVDAEAKSKFIPFPLDITSIHLKNLTMQLDMATSTTDQVHW